jgi:hypothetical protein
MRQGGVVLDAQSHRPVGRVAKLEDLLAEPAGRFG